eukprot:Ihof_evm9s99 gene=Ihof_evmTU9s99
MMSTEENSVPTSTEQPSQEQPVANDATPIAEGPEAKPQGQGAGPNNGSPRPSGNGARNQGGSFGRGRRNYGGRGGYGGYHASGHFQANGWGAQPWGMAGQGIYPREEDIPLSKTNIYIPGLPPTSTDDEIMRMCEKHGKIVSAKAIIDRSSGQCKGYGFVMFEKPAQAQKAVQALKAAGHQVSFAKESYSDRFNANKEQIDFESTNMYMANIPIHYTEQDLEKFLEGWGRVLSTRILRDANGISRGVGFARMETREQCDEVVRTFNQKLALTSLPLQVRYADTMQQKKQRMNERKHHSMPGPMGMAGFMPMPLIQGHMGNSPGPNFFPGRGPNMALVNPNGAGNWMNPMGFPMVPGLQMGQQHPGQMPYVSAIPGSAESPEQPGGMPAQGSMPQLTNQMAAMNMNP